MNQNGFFAELKRRNVYKIAVAYAVIAWLLIQIATQVFPFFEITWAVRRVVLFLMLGFPVALIASWAFEITPEGIKREREVELGKSITARTGRKIVGLTMVAGLLAAGLFAFQTWRWKLGAKANASVVAVVATAAQGIAVLPLVNTTRHYANRPTQALANAQLETEGFWRDYGMALVKQTDPDRSVANAGLKDFIAKDSTGGAYQVALLYAVRKEPDPMFAWLETAYETRDSGLSQLTGTPFFSQYRGDPRFIALCKKLNVQVPATTAKP